MNIKDRLLTSDHIWSDLLSKQKLLDQDIIAGDSAGELVVANILKGDELSGVMDITTPANLTDEFIVKDGVIDNTGGTDTTGKVLIVTWVQWEAR